jgi:hypothetical protein
MSEQENSDILERYHQEFFEAPEWRAQTPMSPALTRCGVSE